jgi:hypothetical protein
MWFAIDAMAEALKRCRRLHDDCFINGFFTSRSALAHDARAMLEAVFNGSAP